MYLFFTTFYTRFSLPVFSPKPCGGALLELAGARILNVNFLNITKDEKYTGNGDHPAVLPCTGAASAVRCSLAAVQS